MNKKITTLFLILALLAVLVLAGCSDAARAGQEIIDKVEQETQGVVAAQGALTPTPAPMRLPAPSQNALAAAQAQQEALADLYAQISPSVVNIKVTVAHPDVAPREQFPFSLPGMPGELPPARGEGSGWIYDAQGHIVTNNHVVADADDILVTFHDGRWAQAELVAADPQADLAVIKVEPPKGMTLQPLPLAQPDSLRVGYSVLAIGAPFGLEETLTTGIVSAIGRSLPVGSEMAGPHYSLPDVIQTDAAINPGNSGGPLLDLSGHVVGVNFAIESPVRGSSGIGFAIPVSIVQRVVPALIEDGKYHYAYLGISGQSITPELAQALNLPDNVLGAYVDQVSPGGPAAKGGVKGGSAIVDENGIKLHKGGDIITAIDDEPVRQFNDLVAYLVTQAAPGQKVDLTVLRNGKEKHLTVTLAERPQASPALTQTATGKITPKAALAIARDAVQEQNLVKGKIKETTVMPDTYHGQDVWVVTLGDGKQSAKVVVDAVSGEVLLAEQE
jgi:2-alkenal reductase